MKYGTYVKILNIHQEEMLSYVHQGKQIFLIGRVKTGYLLDNWTILEDFVAQRLEVNYFSPDYRIATEPWNDTEVIKIDGIAWMGRQKVNSLLNCKPQLEFYFNGATAIEQVEIKAEMNSRFDKAGLFAKKEVQP